MPDTTTYPICPEDMNIVVTKPTYKDNRFWSRSYCLGKLSAYCEQKCIWVCNINVIFHFKNIFHFFTYYFWNYCAYLCISKMKTFACHVSDHRLFCMVKNIINLQYRFTYVILALPWPYVHRFLAFQTTLHYNGSPMLHKLAYLLVLHFTFRISFLCLLDAFVHLDEPANIYFQNFLNAGWVYNSGIENWEYQQEYYNHNLNSNVHSYDYYGKSVRRQSHNQNNKSSY